MKRIAVIFSMLYVFLTIAMLFVRIASRAGPEWAPQFALGYLICALMTLWIGYFLLRRRERRKTFIILSLVLGIASASILATYNIDNYLQQRTRK